MDVKQFLVTYLVERSMQQEEFYEIALVPQRESNPHFLRQESEDNRTPSPLSTGISGRSVLDQEESPIDESNLCSTSPICPGPAPLCRQFWKAGSYNEGLVSKPIIQKSTGYLHIHPKFLHSNATSHKWAFGAIAELLDNAVDEVQNGSTFVVVDKTLNPRDGSSALLIQDDGGGMDPDAMRRCLSFGFSDKKPKSAIGRYGNGFKTSSMRLGADVIVFSRCTKNRKWTQSIGLLSYTFLMQTGYDRIVVPMVDYECTLETNTWKTLNSAKHHMNNLSLLLRWSPYSTEKELLKQFEDVGQHGTKIVIYNLWCNDGGNLELDFESDLEDIRICEDADKNEKGGSKLSASEQHLANRLRFSLRAYLSVLYLRIPDNFCMLLRGRIIEYHNIADDLKHPEFILYRPQSSGFREAQVVTTIGFLKEAPTVNIHGFNVYHKNRLILPFWHVVSYSDSRGRGVVGVLEANFIEPTHNKQDFEKTPVFQKLEQRLKEMTWEYWDYHCVLLGYQPRKKHRVMTSQGALQPHSFFRPVLFSRDATASKNAELSGGAILHSSTHSSSFFAGNKKTASHSDPQKGAPSKQKVPEHLLEPEKIKRNFGTQENVLIPDQEIMPAADGISKNENQDAANLFEENKKLHTKCLEYEKRREELILKVAQLRVELGVAQQEYNHLLAESKLLGVKEEKTIVTM